jgi:hypothetical protein
LIGDNADRTAVKPSEPHHNVPGIILVNFEKIIFVNDRLDNIFYVIRLGRIIRHEGVEFFVPAVGVVARWSNRGVFHVVARQKAQQFSDSVETLALIW